MTNIIVKSYTIQYMCMEVIICQSERSPEILIISQTPMIGVTSKHIRWESEYGGNSPSFWGEFCITLPTQNRIFLTFQNCGNLDLPHVSICVYRTYNLWIWYVSWNVDDILYAYNTVNVKSTYVRENCAKIKIWNRWCCE